MNGTMRAFQNKSIRHDEVHQTHRVMVHFFFYFFCRVTERGMYMKFSHRAALLSAAAASAAVLAGCSAAKPAGSSDLIMIGANLEMTGSNASFGTSSLNGIHMAVEDANINGGVLGKKIQVIGVDNRSEVAGAADALAKLVENGVSVIIGPDTSSNVIALAPQAHRTRYRSFRRAAPIRRSPSIRIQARRETIFSGPASRIRIRAGLWRISLSTG